MKLAEFASTFREIDQEQADHEHLLQWRYQWFNVMFNYFYAFLLVLLAVSLIWWSGNIYKERKDAETQSERDRIQSEELATAEEQKRKAFEEMLDRWAEAGAKMLFGIRDFRSLYGYTAKDLETYLRCPWNRYLEGKKLTDIETIIFKDEQFTGCYRTNAALPRDKAFVKECFIKFLAEETPVCDTSYTFAELTPNGIFLTNEFNADGYAMRWRAS